MILQHRRHATPTDRPDSIEFADLLDPVVSRAVTVDLMEPPRRAAEDEVVPAPMVDEVDEASPPVLGVSRFASTPDDDRLPMTRRRGKRSRWHIGRG